MKASKEQKIFIMNNGCPRRSLDVSRLTRYFELNNCVIAKSPEKADYIIFSSCSCKKDKEEQSFQLIKKLNRYDGELIVIGCLPAIATTRFKQVFKGKYVVPKNLQEIDQFFKDFKVKFSDVPDANSARDSVRLYCPLGPYLLGSLWWPLMKLSMKFKPLKHFFKLCKIFYDNNKISNVIRFNKLEAERAKICFLRIGYGCLGNCAYCGVRNAIGSLKSKSPEVCLEEYKKLLDEGYKYFIFVADDVGAYGLDINSSFALLLEKLSSIDNNYAVNWAISHLEPKWLVKYKSELSKRITEDKIKDILCPIQSGSHRILDLMNRYCDTEDIAQTLFEFKKINPKLILSTQIIVGFPSETTDDLLATLNFIKRIKFNFVHIYPYYDAEHSISSRLNNKIEEKTINERLKITFEMLDKEKIKYRCGDV